MDIFDQPKLATLKSFNTNAIEDEWIVRLNTDGAIDWQKKYFGASNENIADIIELSSDKYIGIGTTDSYGEGLNDLWVIGIGTYGECLPISEETSITPVSTSCTVTDTTASPNTQTISVGTPSFITVVDIISTVNQQAP